MNVVGQSITATCTVYPDVAQMFAWYHLKAPGGASTLVSTVKTQSSQPGPPIVPAMYAASFVPTLPGTWVVRFADSLTPPTTGAFFEEQDFVVAAAEY